MEPKLQFNSSMFGFNKHDVLKYIETLINKNEEDRLSFEEQLSALDLQLNDKTRLYEALLDRERELEARISSFENNSNINGGEDITAIKEKLALETSRAEALKKEVEGLKNSLYEIKSENEKLNANLKEINQELCEYRRQKQNIGSVLMRAQNEADIMISDAETKRDDVILKTQSYINDIRKMYDKYSSQVVLEQNSAKAAANNIAAEFDNILSYISNARTMLDDMASF